MSEHAIQTQETSDELNPELAKLPRYNPPVDIFENAEEYLIVADIPGVNEDAVEVRFDRGELTLEARRPYAGDGTRLAKEFGPGLFRRSFRIPEKVDASGIEAHLQHGVLRLKLPKSEELKPRRIPVSA